MRICNLHEILLNSGNTVIDFCGECRYNIGSQIDLGIANGVNLRNPISGIPILSFPIKPKLILENKIIESDDATRRSSEPETAR